MTALSVKEPVRIDAPLADGVAHIDDLRELMRSVNETTERLHATHAALREQVSRLQGELAEANAQLRRSRSLAALGEMAAGIAHEVRNPLGSIQLYVQLLGEDLADRPQQAELCGKIDRAVAGLDAIVHDVLLFARDMRISTSEATPDDLFDRALAACEALVAGSGAEIVREIESGVALTADVGLLTQSLANVIRNAIEAMGLRDEGSRTLRLAASRRSVRCPDGRTRPRLVFTIDDTGGGIPHDVLDRIFNPFFTTRKTGTGLGLAIVHRIVDAHGGHINVRNRPEGGTRFELCLPEASRPSAVSRRLAVNSREPKADRHKPLQEAT